MHKYPGELSQGMRQRVGIARAFALQPKMLLLDEPFGMLDSLTKMELQEVLLDLWRRNKLTTLMVTHDVDEAIFLSDRVVMMTDGPEAEVGDILDIPFERPRNRAGHPRRSALSGNPQPPAHLPQRALAHPPQPHRRADQRCRSCGKCDKRRRRPQRLRPRLNPPSPQVQQGEYPWKVDSRGRHHQTHGSRRAAFLRQPLL